MLVFIINRVYVFITGLVMKYSQVLNVNAAMPVMNPIAKNSAL
ncbi:hypothetical protein H650_04685 [Enterobacter sp. R4-368]|nr:hypothetical protein H650_04685 [Enterobacter sp. R4-368]